jgi:hypothetical protein
MSDAHGRSRFGDGAPVTTLEELAHRIAPGLSIVAMSRPEPTFRAYNVVGVTNGEDVARQAVISLESEDAKDASIGLVVLSAAPGSEPLPEQVDPEGVTGYVGSRSLLGGVIGAVIGAVLVGGVAGLIAGELAAAIAGAAGGALFGGAIGGIWVTFAGFGGSSAYRQTFIDPDIADVALVSLHTDDIAAARRARTRLAEHEHLEIVELDAEGREVS